MRADALAPASIPEQVPHWKCPDPAAESTLGDNPVGCSTFLGGFFGLLFSHHDIVTSSHAPLTTV